MSTQKAGKAATRFLLIGATVYLLWYAVYEFWVKPHTTIDAFVIYAIVDAAESILNFFGYITLRADGFIPNDTLAIQGSNGVAVGAPCDGMMLFGVFLAFILAFPGAIRHKSWFIPAGLVAIHYINVLRVVALTIIVHINPDWLAFNHDYTFTILVYGFVFLLWYAWIKYFGPKKTATETVEGEKVART